MVQVLPSWKSGDSLDSLFFFFLIFIYLFIWLHQVLVAARRIQFPDQGSNPGPLPWRRGVLTTGPPGQSPQDSLHDLQPQSSRLAASGHKRTKGQLHASLCSLSKYTLYLCLYLPLSNNVFPDKENNEREESTELQLLESSVGWGVKGAGVNGNFTYFWQKCNTDTPKNKNYKDFLFYMDRF